MKTSVFMLIYLAASVSAEKVIRNRGTTVNFSEKRKDLHALDAEKVVGIEDEAYFGRVLGAYSSYPVRLIFGV
jgi:hypothetical protein